MNNSPYKNLFKDFNVSPPAKFKQEHSDEMYLLRTYLDSLLRQNYIKRALSFYDRYESKDFAYKRTFVGRPHCDDDVRIKELINILKVK